MTQLPSIISDLSLTSIFEKSTLGRHGAIFSKVINVVHPKSILEIGFFAGASALAWLYLTNANVLSVDPMGNGGPHDGSLENVQKLKDAFGSRFEFIQKDSRDIRGDLAGRHFDLMFVDGDHSKAGARNDFQIAIDSQIDWLLVDDFVTEVAEAYDDEVACHYFPVMAFPREDQFQGRPIPMVLFRRFENEIWEKLV